MDLCCVDDDLPLFTLDERAERDFTASEAMEGRKKHVHFGFWSTVMKSVHTHHIESSGQGVVCQGDSNGVAVVSEVLWGGVDAGKDFAG